MTTKTSDNSDLAQQKQESPWWERISEGGSKSGSHGLIKKILGLAVVIAVVITAWTLFKQNKATSFEEQAALLANGQALLPDSPNVQYGQISNFKGARQYSMAALFFAESAGDPERASTISVYLNSSAATTYREKIESAIATLDDNQSKFSGDWEWKYLHIKQQLHWFAALNCVNFDERKAHLDQQIAVIKDLRSRFGEKTLLSLEPSATAPGKNVLDLWLEAAEKERKFYDAYTGQLTVSADKNVELTFELENGKILKAKTYSRIAPKGVKNFLDHARAGRYDGTALHNVNPEEGTLTGGSIFSARHPDRKFIWGDDNPGYTIEVESTPLLPVKRGFITSHRIGTSSHGLQFVIHTEAPTELSNQFTVLGEITEGIETMDDWINTEVHDEIGLKNPNLPRVRLGIKTIKVVGKQDFFSDDSWNPSLQEIKEPRQSDKEKAFMEALKAGTAGAKPKEVENKTDDSEGK